MARNITHWTIKVMWNDGTEEFLKHIPNYVSSPVDEHLTNLEDLYHEED